MRLIDADQLMKIMPMDVSAYMVNEAPTVKAIPIPDGATNGDMIKVIFPSIDASVSGDGDVIDVYNLGIYCQTFDTEWWNAPYRVESEVEE